MGRAPGLWPTTKQWLKARLRGLRAHWGQSIGGYGRRELLKALRRLGVREGDVVMLHSAFAREHGFRGSAGDLIETFVEAVGPEGHLLMVSQPYRNAALDWLESGRRFDVRRTPSMMGMVSEVFRRREGVLRSLHPTHPVLALGPCAAELLEGHQRSVHPCGPGTPFGQLAHRNGRVVFFNVPIDTFTFFHYLEHRVAPRLPFPLYTREVFDAPVVDAEGREQVVRTHAFAREAIRRRRPQRLYDALHRRGSVASVRLGATRLLSVKVQDAIDCTDEMLGRGEFFYEMAPEDARTP